MQPHVLVVDDEAILVEEVAEFLTDEEFDVKTAYDGVDALNQFRAAPPGTFTVVLTDLRMPGMDGLALAAAIRRDETEATAVEIILLTGHGSLDTAIHSIEVAMFDFVRKPVRLSELAATVRRAHEAAIARRQAAAASHGATEQLQASAADMTLRMTSASTETRQRQEDRILSSAADLARDYDDAFSEISRITRRIERDAATLPSGQLTESARALRQTSESLLGLVESMLRKASAAANDGGRQGLMELAVARLRDSIAARSAPGREVSIETSSAGGVTTFQIGHPGGRIVTVDEVSLLPGSRDLAIDAGLLLAAQTIRQMGGEIALHDALPEGLSATVVIRDGGLSGG